MMLPHCIHEIEVSPSGLIGLCRKCGFVGRWRDGAWERIAERWTPPPEGERPSPALAAAVAQFDQLSAELREQIDAASDIEIQFMRRIAFDIGKLADRAPDAVIAHAVVMCAAAISHAIAESNIRRSIPAQEVS